MHTIIEDYSAHAPDYESVDEQAIQNEFFAIFVILSIIFFTLYPLPMVSPKSL